MRSSSPHRKGPLEEIELDVDASDVPLHGAQEQRQFHAYYDHHCYLPLYVFCGQAMLTVTYAQATPMASGTRRRSSSC